MLGQTVAVLVEGQNKGRWQGRTRSDKIVFFSGGNDLTGEQVMVTIEKTSPWSLQGRASDK
jgi:tRNA-2-methylthio-N6-dimethylallyladenosine synthase